MESKKKRILVVCAKGMNRSKYLANYLRRKGYSTTHGGIEPHENPNWKWNPLTQKKIDWADVIIIVRKRLESKFRRKFKIGKKKLIVFDVSDSKRLIPDKFKNLKKLNSHDFNLKWTYPRLRKEIKLHLPL